MKVIDAGLKWAYGLTPRSLTSHLIIHHAAGEGPVEAIHNYHLSLGWAGIAYHYYVRKDGSVYRGRPENMRGGHTTNWNWCSIGICFEGNFETEHMPEAQKTAGQELVADIVSRFPSIVVGKHSEYGATSCPGKFFPYEDIINGTKTEPEKNPEDRAEPDEWAEESCLWAVEKGIFLGDGSGNFRWRDAVTRQELAVLLRRFENLS